MRELEFFLANSTGQGGAAGESAPESEFSCITDIKLNTTTAETLVDTGAKGSCIGDYIMMTDPYLKALVIKKCARRAFSVNGSPVVTLGEVDLEFKVNTHIHDPQGDGSSSDTRTGLSGKVQRPDLIQREAAYDSTPPSEENSECDLQASAQAWSTSIRRPGE